jgi:hypothetical protein
MMAMMTGKDGVVTTTRSSTRRSFTMRRSAMVSANLSTMLALDRFMLSFRPSTSGHRNHWGRDLVGEDLDAANEVAVDKEVLDLSGK